MENIRIQDDLYNYVNGAWLETTVIPNDRPTTGGFADLDVDVEKTMRAELEDMIAKNTYPNDCLKNACKLYSAAIDVKRRKREGIRPALPALKRIEKLNTVADLNRHLKDFALDGMPLPFSFSIEPDMKNTDAKLLYLQGPSTILPDTTYYKPEMEQQKTALLGMWQNMVKAVLAKTRLSEEEQNAYIADAIAFDAVIAGIVKSSEEWSEYTKVYNIISMRKAVSALKPLKFSKLCKDLFGEAPAKLSIADPRFLDNFGKLFNEDTFVQYKHWAYINLLLSCCSLLSEELRDLGSSYRRALTGVAQMPCVEKFAYRLAAGTYSEPMGIYYGDKYFGQAAKADVVEMVKEIIETYKTRVAKNDFLDPATKDKAVLKLSTMKIKMGYPDKAEAIYDKLVFDENASLLTIVSTLQRIKREDDNAKFYAPVDHNKWAMPGHMVNACYDPTSNDITFPAAILQAPFYSIKQTRSQNLGGIGAVIGHEISHAFDNNGAAYDEHGNMNNWWTKKDRANFKAKTKAMIKEFEGIVLPAGPVNATLTVSENIADNGGMAVTLDIMSRMKGASFEEYFVNWAKVWCMKAKPEYEQLLLNVDVHGPHILRANMPPRNFPQWYDTFGVTKKDKMYIAPNKRVVIW